MRALTESQLSVLHSLNSRHTSSCSNWAGTPQSSRAALCEKGLIKDISKVPGRHTQWSKYVITELGQNVLIGRRFDEGLAFGYEEYAEQLDSRLNAEHEEALRDNADWDVEHGRRYAANSIIEDDVRAVLWKHVKVVL